MLHLRKRLQRSIALRITAFLAGMGLVLVLGIIVGFYWSRLE